MLCDVVCVGQVVSRKNKYIRIHGALMATAYALLFPLGALFPCHR
jgi:hypothetical protein